MTMPIPEIAALQELAHKWRDEVSPICTCPRTGDYFHKADCPEYAWKRKDKAVGRAFAGELEFLIPAIDKAFEQEMYAVSVLAESTKGLLARAERAEESLRLAYCLGLETVHCVATEGQLQKERVAFVAADDLFHRKIYTEEERDAYVQEKVDRAAWGEREKVRRLVALIVETERPNGPSITYLNVISAQLAQWDRDELAANRAKVKVGGGEMRSVLQPSVEKPSIVGLLPTEIENGVPCACGHRLVKRDMREHWYYQTHSINGCTLELPDLVCWCGLRRSEHVDGHAEAPTPADQPKKEKQQD